MKFLPLGYVVAAGVCTGLNLLKGNPYGTSLFNSLSFLLAMLAAERLSGKKGLVVIGLGLLPIFSFYPKRPDLSVLLAIEAGLLWLSTKTPKYPLIFISLLGAVVVLGTLITGSLLNWSVDLDKERTIFWQRATYEAIERHRGQLLVLPYKARMAVFSHLINLYSYLSNTVGILNLKNVSDTILLANFYPIILGFKELLSRKEGKGVFVLLLTGLLAAGINRSPDRFNSLYFLGPVLMGPLMTGLNKINYLVYWPLLAVSIFIAFIPQ